MSEIPPPSVTPPPLWLRVWQSPLARLIQYGVLTLAFTLTLIIVPFIALTVFSGGRPPMLWIALIFMGAQAAAALGSVFLMGLWDAGPKPPEAGLTRTRWGREMGTGIIWGVATPLLIAVITLLLHAPGTDHLLHWSRLPLIVAFSLLVGIGEEAMFRGFTLPTLEKKWGTTAAWVGSSLIFGAFHLLNPGVLESPAGVAATFLGTGAGGLALGAAFILTRRLWLPIGIHAGWDTVAIFLSGEDIQDILTKTQHYKRADLPFDLLTAFLVAVIALFVARTAHRRGMWRPRTSPENMNADGKIMS